MKYKVLRNIRVASSTGMKVFKVGEVISDSDFIANAKSFVDAKYIEALKEKKAEVKAEEPEVKVEESTEKKVTKKAKKKSKKKSKKKVDA